MGFDSLRQNHVTLMQRIRLFSRLDDAIRDAPITVRGVVVVVGVTSGVDVPRIVGVATIRRTQPTVLRL